MPLPFRMTSGARIVALVAAALGSGVVADTARAELHATAGTLSLSMPEPLVTRYQASGLGERNVDPRQSTLAVEIGNFRNFDVGLGVLTNVNFSFSQSKLDHRLALTAFGEPPPEDRSGIEVVNSIASMAFAVGPNNAPSSERAAFNQTALLSPPARVSTYCSLWSQSSCIATVSDNGDQDFSESARSSELRAFVSNAPALPVTLQLVTYIQPRLSREGNRAEVTTEIALEGDVSATYDYLRHAAPSFSAQAAETSLDIDFGTVAIGAHKEFKWSVFNRGNADTVGLDLDSIASTDEAAGKFVFEHLGPFSALAAGTRKEFAVRLDTSTSGAFVAEYRFGLSDADVGEESTRRSSNLTLRLRGNVAAPVPEPAEWLLMAAGVGTLAYSRRRRRCPPSS